MKTTTSNVLPLKAELSWSFTGSRRQEMEPKWIAVFVSVLVAMAVSGWGVCYVRYVQKLKKNDE
jgi:hypothetical protein